MSDSKEQKKNYNLNLPQTDFSMKANSAVREVEFQQYWQDNKIYQKSVEKRKDAPKFVLHDGPPYLSSDKIHIGTALNKILKDIVTRYKSARGFYSPYVPGYDSHGLPIENAVCKNVKGGRRSMTQVELRAKCREFALHNLPGQEANFRRLGVWGEWENPYVTLDPKFEAAQIRVFSKMAQAGYLYKGLKSVQWCPTCETALAEAEVEYAEHNSHSIFVKFELDRKASQNKTGKIPEFVPQDKTVHFVIWTTTPWTLPGNLAVCLHPEFTYEFLDTKEHGVLVVVDKLREKFQETTGIEGKVLGTCKGADLEMLECKHPFLDRLSRVILGTHVTDDTGSGCVHTAPGHGPEDFEIGQKYNLGIVSPIDGRGILTEEAGPVANGLRYDEANVKIVEHLKEIGVLLNHQTYSHSYPHCWRCKKPLIFRATEQWFASVDGFRQKALEAIDQVTWVPASGRNRIYSMVENRADWCISRQRVWGVPIPVFYCTGCREPLMTAESMEKVATAYETIEHDGRLAGSDAWWLLTPQEMLGDTAKCNKCHKTEFEKETDIMDVWFDSGVTHKAVVDARPYLKGTPVELYLEGSDQHRGWFQSSLLTSVALHGRAPYKTVVTHGFVVDETGRKMSKSLGNIVEPQQVIKEYGADVLRLWVASVNYTDDIRCGKNLLAQLADVYKKLRNTARYMLGNLYDFDPAKDAVPYEELQDIDKYILHRSQEVLKEIIRDFDNFQYFKYYQLLQNFCNVELSNFYFDIAKDTLYTTASKSKARRSIQTVLAKLLSVLVRVLAPVNPHMAEDIWQHVPAALKTESFCEESVLLADFPCVDQNLLNPNLDQFWKELIITRDTVNKALEQARAARKIGSSLEAQVLIKVEDSSLSDKIISLGENLPGFFITSQAHVENGKSSTNSTRLESLEPLSELSENGMNIFVLKAEGQKCGRCWKYTTTTGHDKNFVELCMPCAEVEASK